MKFTKSEALEIIKQNKEVLSEELREKSLAVCRENFGNSVYVRGLIEFTNYCRNNCKYCGIRAGNRNVHRYRLTREEILDCCRVGAGLGFKTYVLQGGEDPGFSDNELCSIVSEIKTEFPESAVTLSVGERSKDVYREFFKAGADRFLLRHETSVEEHYSLLHPSDLSLKNRKRCLYDLKDIGFQVGAGFMVGSPFQKDEYLAEDIMFLQELEPHMVGIGPFIPHKDTEFKDFPQGTLNMTLVMLCITRLALPKVLLPSTTALGTISPTGREDGLRCGTNVVMPNLSPIGVRRDYSLYDGKICMGDEAAECIKCLGARVETVGCRLDFSRGDSPLI